MTDDAPDPELLPIPGRYEVPHAQPRPASVRPGLDAPVVNIGHVPGLSLDFAQRLEALQELFHVARHPRADPLFRRHKPALEADERHLWAYLGDHPDDAAVKAQHLIVLYMLHG